MSKQLYALQQESLDEISGTESLSYDLTRDAGNIEYRNGGINIEDISVPGIKGTITRLFRTPYGRKYRFAFYLKMICITNSGMPYMKTIIYYFLNSEDMLQFIKEHDPLSYETMDKENLSSNDFIYKNNNN